MSLKFFQRTNDPTHWNIASYHDPRSITWSWILAFSRFRPGERKVFPLLGHWRGRDWYFRIPFIGMISLATQKKLFHPSRSPDQ